jgi:hypothetical protein
MVKDSRRRAIPILGWRAPAFASAVGSERSGERYVTSSGRATMIPLCVRTLAT